ncbi:hypothetical protein [Robertmurraya sp. P23]|uniref:hypothetical protein n=1 Tax=Robertmurraya sp. P23 TaxID=3436931 RepID=UPI003D95FF5B
MGIRINIEECVGKNTIKFGIGELRQISSLTIQKQLIQIEKFLHEFCMGQKQLSEQIRECSKLSISSVSTGAKVPRSQINLNTNTLKHYIEKRILEIEKKDVLNVKKFERLKSEKRELETYIDGLRQQTVDSFELKLRFEMLEAQNKRLILQMESRQKDVQKLEEENIKLRRVLNEQNPNKVVLFNNQ